MFKPHHPLILVIVLISQAECISTIHVGEIINSLEKATLIPGGSEAIVYTTLSGTVGMLAPFSSREVCHLWSCNLPATPI